MALLITGDEVSLALSATYTDEEVQLAQDVIELHTELLDLHADDPEDRFDEADLRQLRLAVQWQAAYLRAHPEVLTQIPVLEASANGARIKPAGDGILAPLAQRCLGLLSSAAGPLQVATIRPSTVYRRRQPDLWQRI